MVSKKMTLDQQVEKLLSQMTLLEKISLLAGKDVWNTVPIDRLGIPSITMTDGPHGVRAPDESGRKYGPATCFPTGVSIAASWNTALVEKVVRHLVKRPAGWIAISVKPMCQYRANRAAGTTSRLIPRTVSGRKTQSLTSGCSSQNVGTSLKRYAVNNYEIERHQATSNIDERTL
jgi:beta-glucosidase